MSRDLPSSAVLDCSNTNAHRECVQARAIGHDGHPVVATDTRVTLSDDERGLYAGYDYVRFE